NNTLVRQHWPGNPPPEFGNELSQFARVHCLGHGSEALEISEQNGSPDTIPEFCCSGAVSELTRHLWREIAGEGRCLATGLENLGYQPPCPLCGHDEYASRQHEDGYRKEPEVQKVLVSTCMHGPGLKLHYE